MYVGIHYINIYTMEQNLPKLISPFAITFDTTSPVSTPSPKNFYSIPEIIHLNNNNNNNINNAITELSQMIFYRNIKQRNNNQITIEYHSHAYDCCLCDNDNDDDDKNNKKNNIPNEITLLTKLASNILKNHNFMIDKNKYTVVIHSYNLFGEKIKCNREWHKNIHNIMEYHVHSFIICLRRDITIKGGNLLRVSDYNNYDTEQLFNVDSNYANNSEDSLYEIHLNDEDIFIEKLNENNIILLNGNVKYYMENMTGFGCFDFIEIQFKQKKYNRKNNL